MEANDEARDKHVRARNWVIVLGTLALAQLVVLWWFGFLPWIPRPGDDMREAEFQLWTIESAVDMHWLRHKQLPEDLEALTKPHEGAPAPLLDAVPLDPWGNAYRYRVIDRRSFELRSAGRDGVMETPDDIVVGQGP